MSTPIPQPRPGVIAVASLAQADRHKRKFDAILTLEDPHLRRKDQLRITGPDDVQLVLPFEDVDDAALGFRVATHDQVEKALDFGRDHADRSLLIHCMHGVGRSAAIALAILADRMGPGLEAEAMNALLAIRPESTPNQVVVALADAILGRNGALVAAMAAWEAGEPRMTVRRRHRREYALKNPDLYAKAL